MLKLLQCRGRPLLRTVAATALLFAAFPGARAEENAHVNEMTFDVQTGYQSAVVNVASSDGSKWDQIVPGQIIFWAHMNVDTRWPGYVESIGLFLGACDNAQCGNGYPLIHSANVNDRDFNWQKNFSISTADIPVSGPDAIAVVPYGNQILSQCNAKLQPDGATKPHSFSLPVSVSFSVNTRKSTLEPAPPEVTLGNIPFNGGDHTRTGEFLVQVNCLATSQTTANPDSGPHRTKIDVSKLDLFLTTFAQPGSSQRGPSGTQCKPLKVTTRIATDKAGPVNVKLWRKVDNGPVTSESKQMHAAALGGGKFGDDWDKIENFTQTTTVQYMAEVLGGTFAPSTPWKSITIHCNGDFASPTSNANPDNSLPPGGAPKPNVARDPKVTAPPARVACVGGKVVGGSCACPRTHLAVKKSATAMHCVKSPAAQAAEDARRRHIEAIDEVAAPQRGRLVRPPFIAPVRTAPQRPVVGTISDPRPPVRQGGPLFRSGIVR